MDTHCRFLCTVLPSGLVFQEEDSEMEFKAGCLFGGALGIDPCGREVMEREWTEEQVSGDADPRAASAHHTGLCARWFF